MSVIRVENLNKSIKGKSDPRRSSFTVEQRGASGLDRAKQAGKTTLMDCLLGDRKVTSGTIESRGRSPWSS